MSHFQFWNVLIFLINIYCIDGIDESNRTVKRPWLDLNLDPRDLPEPPEEITISDQNVESSSLIPEDGSSGQRPQAIPVPAAEIIDISDDDTKTGVEILEAGSSSDYNRSRQLKVEKRFKNSGLIWHELRSDMELKNKKWRIICDEMILALRKLQGPLKLRSCSPTPYTTGGWRQIEFKEMKKKNNNCWGTDAPDLLLCLCHYYRADDVKDQDHFAVKQYKGKKYFLLEKTKRNRTSYMLNNIYTLKISSQDVKDKTG